MSGTSVIKDVASEFMEEVYDGPKHDYTWFIGNDPDSGLLGTIGNLSAAEASVPLVKGGTTIAAHVEHLRWSLEKSNQYMRGDKPKMVWAESWCVREVDAEAWARLIEQLRGEYAAVAESMRKSGWQSAEQVKEVLALIPHAAYHLGAIRQMALAAKARRVQDYKSTRPPSP